MNFLSLKYFIIAAEELNFTKASKRLYIAQQSLSKHILRLEEHFGVKLFDRTPPMTLTDAGLCLLRYARRFQIEADELEREMQDIKDFKSSELTIGITRARGAVYMPIILPKFKALYPNIRINLFEDSSDELEKALRVGKTDLIVGLALKDPLGITSVKVWKEQYVVIVPLDIMHQYCPDTLDAATKEPTEVTLKTFEKCPFLATRKYLRVGIIFHKCCSMANITPNVIMETSDMNIALGLCLKGMGALVCPKMFLYPYMQTKAIKQTDVKIFPLDYADDISISYLTNKYMSNGGTKFIDMVTAIGGELAQMF